MSLAKATLTEITGESKGGEPKLGTAVAVQFNPATLKLTLANKVDKQHTQGQQRRQFLGASSTTLAFDLLFDTAEEGSTESPVSVRTKTALVEQFLLPTKDNPSPPRARFEWNELRLDGVIESLTIDFELFASDGTPLRAKMSVTLAEQNRKYQAAELGPASRSGGGAPAPGKAGSGPGSSPSAGGTGTSLVPGGRSEPALSGEAAAQFAARVGIDPAEWRSVTGGLDNPLAIAGGVEVTFGGKAGQIGGLGVTVGVEAGTKATAAQEFGVDAGASVPTRAGVALGPGGSSGFRLAASGGLAPSLDRVAKQETAAAAASTRAAFDRSVPNPAQLPPPDAPGAPTQSRQPLWLSGLPGPARRNAAREAPALPAPDPRAIAYGRGVPLRPSVTGAARTPPVTRPGGIILRPGEVPTGSARTINDLTTAPWTRLPVDRPETREQAAKREPAGCGCRPACSGKKSH
jgi:hypothetical protein